MKYLELSDSDYDSLMELCKELQLQENDGQAHPYFWEPMSSKYERDWNDEGEVMFFDSHQSENVSAKSMFMENIYDELKDEFLKSEESIESGYTEKTEYEDLEEDWIQFIEYQDYPFQKWHRVLEEKSEHNPSLFKSDVKEFINGNQHHLGDKPHTYARTIWRMPKMIELVRILCRINKQEDADNEIKRYCHKELNAKAG